jgi:hypothetical protein
MTHPSVNTKPTRFIKVALTGKYQVGQKEFLTRLIMNLVKGMIKVKP